MKKAYEKKAYEAPQLVVHGDVEEVTQSTGTPGNLDASFPAGTPFGELTFS